MIFEVLFGFRRRRRTELLEHIYLFKNFITIDRESIIKHWFITVNDLMINNDFVINNDFMIDRWFYFLFPFKYIFIYVYLFIIYIYMSDAKYSYYSK